MNDLQKRTWAEISLPNIRHNYEAIRASLPEGCKVHDRRPKTLASEVGDLSFRYRRVRDAFGNTVIKFFSVFMGHLREKSGMAD